MKSLRSKFKQLPISSKIALSILAIFILYEGTSLLGLLPQGILFFCVGFVLACFFTLAVLGYFIKNFTPSDPQTQEKIDDLLYILQTHDKDPDKHPKPSLMNDQIGLPNCSFILGPHHDDLYVIPGRQSKSNTPIQKILERASLILKNKGQDLKILKPFNKEFTSNQKSAEWMLKPAQENSHLPAHFMNLN
tara:strand:- start:1032 stop:1604 length:573 start_codon:yes stop_codon:yes gene_type:complete